MTDGPRLSRPARAPPPTEIPATLSGNLSGKKPMFSCGVLRENSNRIVRAPQIGIARNYSLMGFPTFSSSTASTRKKLQHQASASDSSGADADTDADPVGAPAPSAWSQSASASASANTSANAAPLNLSLNTSWADRRLIGAAFSAAVTNSDHAMTVAKTHSVPPKAPRVKGDGSIRKYVRSGKYTAQEKAKARSRTLAAAPAPAPAPAPASEPAFAAAPMETV